jgi:hypothetical protein
MSEFRTVFCPNNGHIEVGLPYAAPLSKDAVAIGTNHDFTTAVNSKLLAIVGVCVGVALMAFGAPAGWPAIVGPAAVGFWPAIAIVCLILGLIGLSQGIDVWWRREGESRVDDAASRTDRSPSEGMEARLRQLLRLKDEKLISDEEYARKRADILEKW